MFTFYITLAFRNLKKRRAYSFINISGLALGIAACLVIWKYIEFELSYDNFHQRANHLYRATFTEYGNNRKDDWFDQFGYGLAPALHEEIPGIKNYTRAHPLYGDAALISFKSPSGEAAMFREQDVLFVDSTYLDMFTYDFIYGSSSTALDKPSSMVITESIASRYFGKNFDPLGQTLHLKTKDWGDGEYTVTAVIKDVPENAHLHFSVLIPMHNLLYTGYYSDQNTAWSAMDFTTYVELEEGVSAPSLGVKTKRFMDEHTGTEPLGVKLSYQPLRDINLSPDLNNPNGHLSMLYFFLVVAVFILAIAWINYINLSTARATERAKEVGIKKAMGVLKSQLITQFFVEAMLMNFMSVVMALGIAFSLLPFLGDSINKPLVFDLTQPALWMVLGGVFVTGTLVSGFYPAFVLSSFNPVDIIKSSIAKAGRGLSLRKALVVFQFAASLLLIIGTFIIYRQMTFMVNQDKGLTLDRMLIVNGPQIIDENESAERMTSFKNEMMKIASVKNVTTSGAIPGGGYSFTTGMALAGKQHDKEIWETVHAVWVDPDFVRTYGMEIIAGKPWNPASATDMNAVFVNEAVLHTLGLHSAEEALTQRLVIGQGEPFVIQGVIRNFHWNSLKSGFEPMVFRPQKINYNLFTAQLQTGAPETLQQVKQLYELFFPADPFDYYFLEDHFNKQYQDEKVFGRIFTLFASLAIVIACLGLWGLASFTTQQRMKEISIRKVLGATANSIVSLLSFQFVRLFLISALIAVPCAWYAGEVWIDNFAFRITITPDLFIVPFIVLIVIALGTVSLQILRGANSNPAKALRSE